MKTQIFGSCGRYVQGYKAIENLSQYVDWMGKNFLIVASAGRIRDLHEKITAALKEKSEKMLKKPNYLTVPTALKKLEKIVMIRQLDGVYRLDHAVTATQKIILDAFGLNEGNVRYQAKEIGNILQNQ